MNRLNMGKPLIKNIFIFLVPFIVFNGYCQEKNEKISKASRIDSVQSAFDFYCFYHLDDKTGLSDQKDYLWMHNKEKEIRVTDSTQNDLFTIRGAGPNGSLWNPDGDLWICIRYADFTDEFEGYLELGDSIVYVFTMKGELIWVQIPYEDWESSITPMSDSSIQFIFEENYINAVKSGEVEPIAPLVTGYYLQFTFRLAGTTETRYLHMVYGE